MANMSVSFSYYAGRLEELGNKGTLTFDSFHHGDNFNEVAENFYNSVKALKLGTVTIQKGELQTMVSLL